MDNQISLDLADELATNEAAERAARSPVDPRTLPTRHSLLKQMSLSPAHYFEACQRDQDDSLASRLGAFAADRSEALRIGNAIHAKLTGVGKVIVYTGGRRDKRIKAYKEFVDEAAAQGVVEILIPSEVPTVDGVVDAIRRRPDAMKLMFDGTIIEKTIHWEWMGKQVRCTPDARSKTHVTDLKSAVSSEPYAFRRQCLRMHYQAQLELYGHAMEVGGEGMPADSFLIAVEKTRPHPVTIFRLTGEMLELGARLNRAWIERLLQCESANFWPPYAPEPIVIDLDVDEELAA